MSDIHLFTSIEAPRDGELIDPATQVVDRDRKAYAMGWRASQRYGALRSMPGGPSPLERADDRGEVEAWYLGYHDHAADRPKWDSLEADRVV